MIPKRNFNGVESMKAIFLMCPERMSGEVILLVEIKIKQYLRQY